MASIINSSKTVVIVAGVALIIAVIGLALGAAGLAKSKAKQGPAGPQGPRGPPGPAAAGEIFSVYLTQPVNIPAGENFVAVPFNTVDFGNAANWSSSTGTYTFSQDGYYSVTYKLTVSNVASGELISQIISTATGASLDYSTKGQPASGAWNILEGSKILKSKAGDKISVGVKSVLSDTSLIPGIFTYLQVEYLRPL